MKIFVKAKPKAKEEKVVRISPNQFDVWVKELPVQGKANEAVVRVLANYFDTSKSNVRLISGNKAKIKIFEVK